MVQIHSPRPFHSGPARTHRSLPAGAGIFGHSVRDFALPLCSGQACRLTRPHSSPNSDPFAQPLVALVQMLTTALQPLRIQADGFNAI